jgi:hypothetical protein
MPHQELHWMHSLMSKGERDLLGLDVEIPGGMFDNAAM